MPRYFFHLFNDLDVLDDEGRELPDIAAALSTAETDAREMAAESVRRGHLNLSHCVEVRDEADHVLFRVCFGDVVTVSGL